MGFIYIRALLNAHNSLFDAMMEKLWFKRQWLSFRHRSLNDTETNDVSTGDQTTCSER